MDTLTHGLLGLAIACVRRPEAPTGEMWTPTDRAVVLGAVLAAELPDLDYFLPAANEALHALRAHRGWSHAVVVAPVIAMVAMGIAKLVFRRARPRPVYWTCLASVLVAHLLCDTWTGWGTRLLLPFSDQRIHLDWTMVIDPWFTGPLLAGAILVVARRRGSWRRAMLAAAAVSVLYLGFRVTSHQLLGARLHASHPAATRIDVFPALLSPHRWRFVAVEEDELIAGTVALGSDAVEQSRTPRGTEAALIGPLRADKTVVEAMAWARFPIVSVTSDTVRIADLRYHLGGAPTLTFVLAREGDRVVSAKLDRGGSFRELLRRW